MVSTLTVVAVFMGLLVLHLVLWAALLWLGLRWARAGEVTSRRLIVATVAVFVIHFAFNVTYRLLEEPVGAHVFSSFALMVIAVVLLPCAVIAWCFRLRFLRALQAWLPTLLAPAVMLPLVLFVVRPFVLEAFVIPANSMAPTLLGRHVQSICPQCGQPNYCTPPDPRFGGNEKSFMICGNFHVSEMAPIEPDELPSDRLIVSKIISPRRLDLVVFQLPEEPSTLYVKRLVGLPGETIHIEDGAVWVNGSRMAMPDSLRGLRYASEIPHGPREMWGTKDLPAVLGADEYFVLGDFSVQSKDSRMWQRPAPGHNPYAVPRSHLRGVVTHIYWPPERWRVFR